MESAGILIYRINNKIPEVLLVHPGGPYWMKKDLGAWSIPKGEVVEGEDPLKAAVREVEEETGWKLKGTFIPLKTVKQKSGKYVHAWAFKGNFDPGTLKSNEFEIEWPPRTGKKKSFPEVDKAEWFAVSVAIEKIIPGQVGLIHELEEILNGKK